MLELGEFSDGREFHNLLDALARFDFGSPSGLVAGKDNAAGEGTER